MLRTAPPRRRGSGRGSSPPTPPPAPPRAGAAVQAAFSAGDYLHPHNWSHVCFSEERATIRKIPPCSREVVSQLTVFTAASPRVSLHHRQTTGNGFTMANGLTWAPAPLPPPTCFVIKIKERRKPPAHHEIRTLPAISLGGEKKEKKLRRRRAMLTVPKHESINRHVFEN